MFFNARTRLSHISLNYASRYSSGNRLLYTIDTQTVEDARILGKIAGILAACMLPAMGIFYLNRPHSNNKLIGPPAPSHLKDKSHPWQLVISSEELESYGEGAGMHGRSNPQKKRNKSTGFVGFVKESSEGRDGFFNELIYHRLGEKIFGDLHPRIHVVESTLEDDSNSEYSLCIESVGVNTDLKTYAEQQSAIQNPQDLSSLKIEHLGRSVAFASLIRSSDSFMKNYVIRMDKKLVLYPIDFELIDSRQRILFVNFKQDPHVAAKHLITKGGVLDYKKISDLNHLERERIQNGGDTEVGTGEKYGTLFYELLERSCVDDIENGLIQDMYRSIAVIEPNDIDDIVDDCAFLMTKEEVLYYKNALHHLVEETKTYMEKFEQDPEQDSISVGIK